MESLDMMSAWWIVGGYLLGIFLTLTFLKFFGKYFLADYDIDDKHKYPGDWDNNSDMYLAFSILWLATIPVGLICIVFKIFYVSGTWYLNLGKKK